MASVLVSKNNGIATVLLNRPTKRNAMSFELLRTLYQTALDLKKDKSIRVIVLAGQGEAFSAGIDLGDLNSPKNSLYAGWELIKPGQSIFQKAFLIWQTMPVPVIAVLHGYCFGAGMQLALAADFRISTPDCKLSIMEGRWGLVPDMGLSRSLAGLVPLDVAKELTMTARIFNGEEAQALKLVTHLSATPMEEALTLATELMTRSPDAVLASKRVLNAMVQQPEKSLRLEKLWQLRLILGKNSRIARSKPKQGDTTPPKYQPRQYG